MFEYIYTLCLVHVMFYCFLSAAELCAGVSFMSETMWNMRQHTRVCRKIEDKASQEGEEHAGDDDVDDEVQWEPQHEEVVGDVQVRRVRAASVVHPVLPATEVLHHPLSTFHEVTQIRAVTILMRRRRIYLDYFTVTISIFPSALVSNCFTVYICTVLSSACQSTVKH